MKNYMLMYHYGLAFSLVETLANAEIDEWLQVWPGMIFFKGAESEGYYLEKIKAQKNMRVFMIAEYDPTKARALMPPQVWDWLKPPATHSVPAASAKTNAEAQFA